jgi:uncharacterized protein DUF6765
MNLEFHYYLTGLIARRAGFSEEEAEIIAYASQFTDNNVSRYKIRNKNNEVIYQNYISQSSNILVPRRKLWRIYPIFHFIPGQHDRMENNRIHGNMHWLNTTPDSQNANDLIDESFKADKELLLYRIGIASHSYTDTWAHQNFVGSKDIFNHVPGNFWRIIVPNFGHLDVCKKPDKVNYTWSDKRFHQHRINNNERILNAAERLFIKYAEYTKMEELENTWLELDSIIKYLIDISSLKKRKSEYKKKIHWLPEYDKHKWLKQSVKGNFSFICSFIREFIEEWIHKFERCYFKDEDGFTETHWYKFQDAVKAHQKYALKIYDDRLGDRVKPDDKF